MPREPKNSATKRNPRNRNGTRKLDEKKVIELVQQGMCDADIARHQGVNRSTIGRFIKRIGLEPERVEAFREEKADVLAGLQANNAECRAILYGQIRGVIQDPSATTITQKMSLLQGLSICSGIDNQNERLERGQSTSNVQSLLVSAQRDLDTERRGKRDVIIEKTDSE